METVTHNLFAILLQIIYFKFLIFPFNILFTVIFAFLSHIIMDGFAKITYHTPDAQKGDNFWIIWHIVIYSLSILSIIIFIIPFWLVMLIANIMDIWDWFFLRSIQKRKKKRNPDSKWGEGLFIHPISDWFRDKFLFWLPNWNYKKSGILIEILINLLFVLFILLFMN